MNAPAPAATTLTRPVNTLAERYREYLFDSMPCVRGIGYDRHSWEDCLLIYSTDDGYELRVTVSLEDDHESVTEKLQLAYEAAREQEEYESVEAEEIAMYDRSVGLFFHLYY